jgi:hypothetical protein
MPTGSSSLWLWWRVGRTAAHGSAEVVGECWSGPGRPVGQAPRRGRGPAGQPPHALIPFTSGQLSLALGGLFFIFLAFEFTLVGSLPLITELVPGARFRVMSLNGALHSAGRMLGALAGTALFPLGIVWSGLAAAL